MTPLKVRYAHDAADPFPVCRCSQYTLTAAIACRGNDLELTETHSPNCRRGKSLLPPHPPTTDVEHDCGTRHRKLSAAIACHWSAATIDGTGHLAMIHCPTRLGPQRVSLFADDDTAAEAIHQANIWGCSMDCDSDEHDLLRLVLP